MKVTVEIIEPATERENTDTERLDWLLSRSASTMRSEGRYWTRDHLDDAMRADPGVYIEPDAGGEE